MKILLALLLSITTHARVANNANVMPAAGNIPTWGAVQLNQSAAVTGILSNANTTATSANTVSTIVLRDGSGNFSCGTVSAALSGNASTMTALAANPTDCGVGEFASAIDASGNLTCSVPGGGGGSTFNANLNNGVIQPITTFSAPVKEANPPTLPVNTGFGAAYSPDGKWYAQTGVSSPWIQIFQRSNGTLLRLANTGATPVSSCDGGVAWSPDSSIVSCAMPGTPFVTNWTISPSGILTKLSDPIGGLPAGSGNGLAWSPDGRFLAIAHSTSPFISIYERTGTTFTKIANPATLPTGIGFWAAFSPNGQFLAVAHNTSPFITIYEISGSTFTKIANPATLPANQLRGVAFSPDSTLMTTAGFTSPYITNYSISGTTFTKLADPATLPTATAESVTYSPDGTHMAVGFQAAPAFYMYSISGTTFTKLTDPASPPTGTIGYAITFSPDNKYLTIGHDTSPYVSTYKTASADQTLLDASPVILYKNGSTY